MRKFWTSAAVVSGALATLVMTGATAYADVGFGSTWNGCTNKVVLNQSNGQMYAYGIMDCTSAQKFLNPNVALSGNNGANGWKDASAACTWVTRCVTPTVYLPEIYGVRYNSSNSGTMAGILVGPEWSVAHVTRYGGDRS
ncbi:hypothetical protein [Streptomyces sp. NPDC056883]|uniref:hypothetical protein n=1 Tax=Streptomyces sp. NPDC056883 TaxID=3345959 RepID=UPI0036C6F9AD